MFRSLNLKILIFTFGILGIFSLFWRPGTTGTHRALPAFVLSVILSIVYLYPIEKSSQHFCLFDVFQFLSFVVVFC